MDYGSYLVKKVASFPNNCLTNSRFYSPVHEFFALALLTSLPKETIESKRNDRVKPCDTMCRVLWESGLLPQ